MAEDIGIQSLAVHGRSRARRFNGLAEYDTIAEVVAAVNIPVFANGDINSGQNAQKVLNHTAASGVVGKPPKDGLGSLPKSTNI